MENKKRFLLLSLASMLGFCILYPKEMAGATVKENIVNIVAITKIDEFGLAQVKLTDPYYMNAFEKEIEYLKSLDADRFLAGFRQTAGLDAKAPKYGSWENMEIRGHSLGHYLSAISQAYACTQDPELFTKINYIISELKTCQDTIGTGYLSAFPDSFFTRLEKGQAVWVPWYTMHKILAGLIDVCKYTNNPTALEVAVKLGDWIDTRTGQLSKQKMQSILLVEYGGMNEALYNLALLTNNPKYIETAHRFDQTSLFDDLANNVDVLAGKHANTQIPKIVGAMKRYEIVGDPNFKAVARNFWDIVTHTRTYVTGGNSENEHFAEADNLAGKLSALDNETCNAYNMLKLTRELFQITGDVKYADFYENAFLNDIMASQNPETGMTTYFQPMKTGYFKVFSTPYKSFWCCTGTGMENFTKLNNSIYFHDKDSVYVNQYLSSTLDWAEKNFKLTQTTNIPVSDITKFTIHLNHKADNPLIGLKIRVPYWVKGKVTVKINDKPEAPRVTQGYITISRKWADNDTVEVTLPAAISVSRLPDDNNRVAFTYGPVVLCATLGTNNMEIQSTGIAGTVKIPSPDDSLSDFIIVSGKPEQWINNIKTNLVRTSPEKLEFQLRNANNSLVFVPFYSEYKERYGIYWKVVDKNSGEIKRLEAERVEQERIRALTVDQILIANEQNESAHHVQSLNSSTGTYCGKSYRDCGANGFFSYDLTVLPDQPMVLVCKYWGSDVNRTFDILIDDVLLTTQMLNNNKPNEFYDERYKIPLNLTKGKTKITIQFRPDGNSMAGGVFGCTIMKDK
jgi:Uncharacterized protein conserved in bacteria